MIRERASRLWVATLTAAGLTVLVTAAASTSLWAARTDQLQGAGIHSSTYGRPNDPGPRYWARVGTEIAARFPGAKPEAIWIVSRLKGRGTQMSFPLAPGGDPLITGMAEDVSEPVLRLFDELGYRVWLQTEPGWAPVDQASHVMLDRYGRHRCVVGVGVDIEWHRSNDPDRGDPVTDEMARTWLAAARSHNPSYRMFLKHFRANVMPSTVRDGILFVDDAQIYRSADEMIDSFARWGRTFAPAVKEIGDCILAATPNTEPDLGRLLDPRRLPARSGQGRPRASQGVATLEEKAKAASEQALCHSMG
jgi:hypothetical protein